MTAATVHLFPTGESIDPTKLDQSQYWAIEWVAYVLFKTSEERTRPTRVITSHGPLRIRDDANPGAFRDIRLQDEVTAYDDQTSKWMGTYRVAGISREDTGARIGLVPSIRIKHQVVK